MYVTINATMRERNSTILTELKNIKPKLQVCSMSITDVVISLICYVISFTRTQIVTIQKGSRGQLQEDDRNGIQNNLQKQILTGTLKQDSEEVQYLVQAEKVSLFIFKCM
jgi:hypothetical protein